MSNRQAGIDLQLPPLSARSARELASLLRDAIDKGHLASGSRMPSARQLALDLGLSKNTVAEAYAGLAAEGVVRTEIGAGTWVSDLGDCRSSVPRDRAARPRLDLCAGVSDTPHCHR